MSINAFWLISGLVEDMPSAHLQRRDIIMDSSCGTGSAKTFLILQWASASVWAYASDTPHSSSHKQNFRHTKFAITIFCTTFAVRFAGVLKLVDKPDLGSGAVRRMGSIPFARTRGHLHSRMSLFRRHNWLNIYPDIIDKNGWWNRCNLIIFIHLHKLDENGFI